MILSTYTREFLQSSNFLFSFQVKIGQLYTKSITFSKFPYNIIYGHETLQQSYSSDNS